MIHTLNGSTRIYIVVGDPIGQAQSPTGVTKALVDRGYNAICIPAHVSSADLRIWLEGVSRSRNVDGVLVTVPHKFSCRELCSTVSERANFLGCVNVMRRNMDGTWHGEMFDGIGYVSAMMKNGFTPSGKRTLLVGAGGAGSAIAYALLVAGVTELAIHDTDVLRRDALVQRLATLSMGLVRSGCSDPSDFDIIINATPIGMKTGDPYPIDVSKLTPRQFVGCVITAPEVSPLIQFARTVGCQTLTGAEMFSQVCDLAVDFLCEAMS